MSSQTFAKVSLILKVLDFKTRQISIVSLDGNTIPSFFVEQNINYEIQIEKFLNSNFQILSTYLDLLFIGCRTNNDETIIYYTSFIPKELLDDKINFLQLDQIDTEDLQMVHKGLRISPYG